MRRCVFLPLVVTVIWSYLKCCVFMTGSFSTELSAAGAGAVVCASRAVAPIATSDGSRKPRSRRVHFMTGSFVGPAEAGRGVASGFSRTSFRAACESARDHWQLVNRLRVVSDALRRRELLAIRAERAAADDEQRALVGPRKRDADHTPRRRDHAEVLAVCVEHLHARRRRHIQSPLG